MICQHSVSRGRFQAQRVARRSRRCDSDVLCLSLRLCPVEMVGLREAEEAEGEVLDILSGLFRS